MWGIITWNVLEYLIDHPVETRIIVSYNVFTYRLRTKLVITGNATLVPLWKRKVARTEELIKPRANANLLSSFHEGTTSEFGFCIAEVRTAARRIPLSELFIIPLSDVPPLPSLRSSRHFTSTHQRSSPAAILRLCLLNFIYSNPVRLLKVTSRERGREMGLVGTKIE